MMRESAMAVSAVSGSSIDPGEQTVSVALTVSFELD
jgi:uncharacterized protein YggE